MVPGRRATLRAVAAPLRHRVYVAIGMVLTHPRFHPIHRRLYRLTGGRGVVGRALGMDMILVTVTGRRTGEPRVVPLGAVRDGDAWVLIGSNSGKPRAPSWTHNLRANPHVTVEHRDHRLAHRAREAAGGELDRLWRVVVEAYPGYAVYRERTDRVIPIFVLEPVFA